MRWGRQSLQGWGSGWWAAQNPPHSIHTHKLAPADTPLRSHSALHTHQSRSPTRVIPSSLYSSPPVLWVSLRRGREGVKGNDGTAAGIAAGHRFPPAGSGFPPVAAGGERGESRRYGAAGGSLGGGGCQASRWESRPGVEEAGKEEENLPLRRDGAAGSQPSGGAAGTCRAWRVGGGSSPQLCRTRCRAVPCGSVREAAEGRGAHLWLRSRSAPSRERADRGVSTWECLSSLTRDLLQFFNVAPWAGRKGVLRMGVSRQGWEGRLLGLNLEPFKDERGATRSNSSAEHPGLVAQTQWVVVLNFCCSQSSRVVSHSSLGVSAKGKGWLALLKRNM